MDEVVHLILVQFKKKTFVLNYKTTYGDLLHWRGVLKLFSIIQF